MNAPAHDTRPSREEQMAQAEAILGDRLKEVGFAKGLFFGRHLAESLPPYPVEKDFASVAELAPALQAFCQQQIDPAAIDRQSRIPDAVIAGLGRLGVLGACLPKSCGGLDLTQTAYCRLLEILGGHCGATALFVNAHHSIGPRALVLFGTEEQKRKWLPKLASGEWISAFALTEPEAGSDAANVQTRATPTPDGKGFLLRGEKRWITNGGVAQVLTVMARTPAGGPSGAAAETRITAFLATPDMPGFRVVEQRMDKMGVRGTATSRLAFEDMFVPNENVLGKLGKGLRIALTVLDFGRTTFGACCTGAAKFCVEESRRHATTRVQFGQRLGEFELVKEKLANMQAHAYAMEACTYQTAALIDAQASDFMLETAMLKVFSTEALWRIINDTFQLHGGLAYFTDRPFERMLRDARINTIGEGANDVLRAFTALVGMRDVGLELESILSAIKNPLANMTRLGRFASRKLGSLVAPPQVELRSPALEDEADRLARAINALGRNVERLLRTWQKEVVDRQHDLGRIADVATELYVCSCVLRRLDQTLHAHRVEEAQRKLELASARTYLNIAHRRMKASLRALWENDDSQTNDLANRVLGW